MMVVAPYQIYDENAANFIDASNTTDDTIRAAIQKYVITAKDHPTAPWWNKIIADYPVIGSTASSQAINLKSAGTFDLTFVNTVAGDHTSNGWKPNGFTSYARTGIIPNTHTSNRNVGIGLYSREENASSGRHGAKSSNTQQLVFIIRISDLIFYDCYNDLVTQGRIVKTNPSSAGWFSGQRLAADDQRVYKNGVQIGGPHTTVGGSRPPHELYFGCVNEAGIPTNFASRQLAWMSVTDGLTSDQEAARYAAIQEFQNSLGRAV